MDNLKIYNNSREVPKEAQKEIKGGRMSGKTDINPMWRIKTLTEQFGVCGIGWKYAITKQWLERGGKEEISAFVNIELFIKVDGEWSDAIPGTGGSSFVSSEKNGLFTSDECFKMALTDAISVSCKALGVGADIYWDKDSSKYDKPVENNPTIDKNKIESLKKLAEKKGVKEVHICAAYKITKFEQMEFSSWKAATDKLNLKPDHKVSELEGII